MLRLSDQDAFNMFSSKGVKSSLDILPAGGEAAPVTPLRESGVTGEEKGRLRLLLLRGLESPLKEGEWERGSLLSLLLLLSGSSRGVAFCPPPTFRLLRPSTASSRLCSRLPFPSNNKGKSLLSISWCNPRPPLRPPRAPRGELQALGLLTEKRRDG